MSYVPPPPGSTTPGQPTPEGVPKQDAHIADLPPEVRKSFLLSMVFFPTLVGGVVCAIIFLGWWTVFSPKHTAQYAAELRSADMRVRWQAAREMAEHIRPYGEALERLNGKPGVPPATAQAGIYDPETLTALLEILENPALDKEADNWAPTTLIRNADERGSRLRWWAAEMTGHVAGVLGNQADKDRALAALLKALEEKNLGIYAARGLGLLKDGRARDPLVRRLLEDRDSGMKAAAVNALGAIGGHAAISNAPDSELETYRLPLRSAFAAAAAEKDDMVLDNTAIALARLKDPTGKERLMQLTKHDDAVIREHAQRALKLLSANPN